MKRLALILVTGLAVFFGGGLTASAADFPTVPRVTAAVAAWKTEPVYVDPLYAEYVGTQDQQMAERIATAPAPVFVAVLPTGTWFQEKDDTERLAGWLAVTNGKPGIYVVMDGTATTGVAHLVGARAPFDTFASSKTALTDQLSQYLEHLQLSDRVKVKPARTAELPTAPERTYERERFTVGKAIGNGIGGMTIGLMGGALLAGIVLGLAALVASRRGGQQ